MLVWTIRRGAGRKHRGRDCDRHMDFPFAKPTTLGSSPRKRFVDGAPAWVFGSRAGGGMPGRSRWVGRKRDKCAGANLIGLPLNCDPQGPCHPQPPMTSTPCSLGRSKNHVERHRVPSTEVIHRRRRAATSCRHLGLLPVIATAKFTTPIRFLSLQMFSIGNRAGRHHCGRSDFLGDLPFPPLLHSGIASFSTHFTHLVVEPPKSTPSTPYGIQYYSVRTEFSKPFFAFAFPYIFPIIAQGNSWNYFGSTPCRPRNKKVRLRSRGSQPKGSKTDYRPLFVFSSQLGTKGQGGNKEDGNHIFRSVVSDPKCDFFLTMRFARSVEYIVLVDKSGCGQMAVIRDVSMEQRWNAGRWKRKIPEKTRRPAASSGTIPTYVNPGVTPPGNRVRVAKVEVLIVT
ncbi:hypothetical protein PR048_015147 [Dryococelus australis]|uniref:Uncharacterized protein n=1 Tax=Dryococelus australis TaxID=614101 RepID=A0ABQ9HG62_9NEOP|nr:hypothetical protein PR048_015147 [Dryococelus australis]